MPWNNKRIIDNLRGIGNDANNPFDTTNPNADNLYIFIIRDCASFIRKP
ncbi:hypothetical protein [Limosilactobacillus antri]